ncbi:GumC family protein [Methylococcus geothermalis]|uniref:non-specific protein-tyrosine kinase n=1 Tax=Methylococcus geothermalis TaxID=2681310 RepID=A0A858Q9Y7_9GAMM|nr:polysaccharide biosynthesis tyrosine autokinase [Methylococcus geothermalis]QJD30650.1 polysaccharide biosynthesis tyrosine autokinase [Methylococcus geothermalis]
MTDKNIYSPIIQNNIPQVLTIPHDGGGYQPEEEEFDLRRYWSVIRRHLWGILGLAVSVSVLTLLILLSMTPIFRATATLIVEPKEQKVVSVEELYGVDTKSKEYYLTQVEILKSRAIARKVIEKLNLTSSPEFIDDDEEKDAGDRAEEMGPVGPYGPQIPTQMAVAKSGALQEGTGSEDDSETGGSWLDLGSWFPFGASQSSAVDMAERDPVDAVVDKFLKRLNVTGVRNTQLVQISFDAASPELAMRVANAVCDAYIDANFEARSEGTQLASKWLATRLEGLRQKLVESERRLQAYLENQKLVDIAGASSSGMPSSGVSSLSASQLSDLNAKYIDARKVRLEAETLYSQIASLGGQVPDNIESMPAIYGDETVRDLKQQEHEALTRVNELASRYGAQHPERVTAETHLESIRAALKKQVASVAGRLKQQIAAAYANENALAGQIDSIKSELQGIARKESVYRELQREVQSNRELYEMFFKRLKETSEAGDLQPSNARVMDAAVLPKFPVKPNKKLGVAIAFVLSLMAGVGLAFLLDFMDKSFRSSEEVEQKLGLPLLGLVPLVVQKQKRGVKEDVSKAFLEDPRGMFAESVRTIRTGIMLSALDDPRMSILVTSSVPGEGKSSISMSLAYALAQLNSRVLVVEADLRRPNLAKRCGLSAKMPGLSNLVVQTATLEECIHHYDAGHIDLMPAGLIPPNPLELLSSHRFAEAMAELESEYDAIILDAPPMQPVSDALALSRLVRSVIYVIQAEKTPVHMARSGIDRLRKVRAPLTGVVLSQLNIEKSRRGYSSYYYGDYYYGSYQQEGAHE